MIITKVRLSRRAGTQGSLAKVLLTGAAQDQSHGLVWSLFSRADKPERDFLFREIEPGAFIIVAHRPPDDPHSLWDIAPPKPYSPELKAGDRLGFVLRANPAMAISQPNRKRSKHVDVIMHAKQGLAGEARRAFSADDTSRVAVDWLAKRGPSIGAEVDTKKCTATGYTQVRIPKAPKPITFSQIDFSGQLTVTDSTRFQASLFDGIGKARSYGCGLVLVRRIHDYDSDEEH
jgi:CRISPR system Cascade subunit CasE